MEFRPKRSIEDYADLLDLPHHVSPTRPPLSRESRASQFSPFAALTGFEAVVAEVSRHVDSRPVLDESQKEGINARLAALNERLQEKPTVTITCFVQDEHKEGGRCETMTARLKNMDPITHTLTLTDGRTVAMDDLIEITEAEEE